MNDNNIRRTIGSANQLGQSWEDRKRITQSMYEKPHFPYWQFMGNSKTIYTKIKLNGKIL